MPRSAKAAWAVLGQVTPNLYVCGVGTLNETVVRDLHVDLVVNCTEELPDLTSTTTSDVERLKLWLPRDGTGLDGRGQQLLDAVVERIGRTMAADRTVLLHCTNGVSRSAFVCMAYLVRLERLTLRQAYEYLAARRPWIRPHPRFWKQLILFERRCRGSSTVRLLTPDDLDDVIAGVAEEAGDLDLDEHLLPDVYPEEQPQCLQPMTAVLSTPICQLSKCKSAPLTCPKVKQPAPRRRSISDNCAHRFIPKLEPVLEAEP